MFCGNTLRDLIAGSTVNRIKIQILAILALLIFSGCQRQPENPGITVTIIADGRQRVFIIPAPTTVEEFLRDPRVDIQLNPLDRINPPPFTQITEGMQISVARVTEQTECEQSEIPYRQTTALNEGLSPGEQRVVQAGENGILETCFRVTLVDGVSAERIETNRTEVKASIDEIIYVGPTGEIEPVPIMGTLAYISNGNAWIIRGSSTNKTPVTTEGDLDRRVFSLASNGRQLLFTRRKIESGSDRVFGNQLWMMPDVTRQSSPVSLVLDNVLLANWIPNQDNTITYSTAEPRDATPGWLAFNDLWQMRIDPQTGESLSVHQILDRSGGGLYGWWGTRFEWSPDGRYLAWAQADGIGLVDWEANELSQPLLNYAVFRPVSDWSWRATLSWSPDSGLLLTTVHGPPVGGESPESSPAFDVAITSLNGDFNAPIITGAGIWSAPQFSPFLSRSNSEFPVGYLAYLQAREPFNSINGEYDLIIADRDGSNARVLFPTDDRPGLRAQASIFQNREFAWSPDGSQIALIYQGNLWVVDAGSGVSHQLTLDGGASNPVWSQ